MNARRPRLREVPLADVLPLRPGVLYFTCSPGRWDGWLRAAYDVGAVLSELDDDEIVTAAYQRPPVGLN
jgi:hypothetical protein